ncbi:MAG: hypothetical protein ACYTGR_18625 [Planctomycetota bacterium]|jgi:hypothetical protein
MDDHAATAPTAHDDVKVDVTARLASLERRQRWAGAVAAFAGAALLLGGAGPIGDDPPLPVPAVFETSGPGGSVWIGIDETGRPRLLLRDSGGHDRIELRIDKGATPRISLRDQAGAGRIELSLLDEATPRIMLLDERGKDRAKLFLMPDGSPLVYLKDRDGTPRAEMASVDGRFHGFVVFDEERSPSGLLAEMPGGAALLRLRQPDDSVWSAPPALE